MPQEEVRLKQLLRVFLSKNRQLNLSAFRQEEQCWIGNILDALAFTDIAPSLLGENWREQKLTIADVGTGGGFPLLPLAIVLPASRFIGIDAVRKKIEAVKEMVGELELSNVELLCARAEEAGRQLALRGKCDLVLSRAVAPVAVLLEYAMPLLKIRGRAVFWKSVHIADELTQSTAAHTVLAAHLSDRYTYTLPKGWGERQLIVFTKQQPTADEYPRRPGMPKQRPL